MQGRRFHGSEGKTARLKAISNFVLASNGKSNPDKGEKRAFRGALQQSGGLVEDTFGRGHISRHRAGGQNVILIALPDGLNLPSDG